MPLLSGRMEWFHGADVIARQQVCFDNLRKRWSMWLCFCAVVFSPSVNAVEDVVSTNTLSIAELQSAISEQGRVVRSFRVQGVVCAVIQEQKIIVLQDDTAAVLLEIPCLDDSIRTGERVVVEGDHCSLVRSRFGVRVGSALVLENKHDDGIAKTGSVFLGAGLQPIRLEWFNNRGDPALDLEYEEPGVPPQKVPASILRQRCIKTNQIGFQNGLHFEAYLADDWKSLSDFGSAKAVAEGTATNIDLTHRARSENTGLKFDGYLEITKADVYTFHLASQDGSILYVGDPSPRCRITVLGQEVVPSPKSMGEEATDQRSDQRIALEGEVTFAGWASDGLEFELTAQTLRARVTVISNSSLTPADLLHHHIKVVGIREERLYKETGAGAGIRVVVPSEQQIEIHDLSQKANSQDSLPDKILTSAYQVRCLRPDEAKRGLRVKLKGVVIWTSSFGCVLQDSTGGVYGHFAFKVETDEADEPRVGDLFEVEGTTNPGDFSPVIFVTKLRFLGATTLPEPIRPTWDQLMNGSLDAEYCEIRGVITDISQNEMTLLTPDGKLTITADENVNYQLPSLPTLVPTTEGEKKADSPAAFVGSVVRIRGCLTAIWNFRSGQVQAGIIHLSPAIVQVEEMAPRDPFALPTRKVVDLLRFDPRASALQRTKVAGQIIHVSQREFYISDEGLGLQIPVKTSLPFRAGDLVEAVGFPQLGGPALVLQEAQIRQIGHTQLPTPIQIPFDELLNHNYDSTLVRIKATLINDTVRLNERVLELQAGRIHFLARLAAGPRTRTMFSPGSQLELNGVYVSTSEGQTGSNFDPFELLLNNAADIIVLQQPSWWTVRHAVTLAAILAGALCLAFIWITALHRKVEERTLQLQEEIETRQLVEQHRVMEQERSRVARDLHDELGAGLTEVGILGALAKNPLITPKEKERYLSQLTESARTLVTGLDEIVWAINPHYDSVNSLATYYSLFAQRFLNLAGIACRLRVAESFPEHSLDSKVRHSIFLAFKEALNNIVRHSEASEAEIRIEVVEDQLLIAVHDNGRGLEAVTGVPGSDGLAGMRERLRQLGGDCLISSHAGQGTNVEFRLYLNRVLT